MSMRDLFDYSNVTQNLYRMLLFSVNFLVSSIGCANKCSLELPLLLLPERAHHRRAELLNLFHGILGILTAQELHVPESVGETNQLMFWKPILVEFNKCLLECPVVF